MIFVLNCFYNKQLCVLPCFSKFRMVNKLMPEVTTLHYSVCTSCGIVTLKKFGQQRIFRIALDEVLNLCEPSQFCLCIFQCLFLPKQNFSPR